MIFCVLQNWGDCFWSKKTGKDWYHSYQKNQNKKTVNTNGWCVCFSLVFWFSPLFLYAFLQSFVEFIQKQSMEKAEKTDPFSIDN
jgi:hypothetical protein